MPCEFLNLTSQVPFLDRGKHSFFTQSSLFYPHPYLSHTCQLFDLAKDCPEPWNPTLLLYVVFLTSQIYLTLTFSVIRFIWKRKIGALGNGIKAMLPSLITFCLLKRQ